MPSTAVRAATDCSAATKERPSGGDKAIAGGPGADLILGGRGADALAGEGGDDLLVDGPLRESSQDTLSGGKGSDRFDVVNRPAARDIVGCGPGRDVVLTSDRKDIIGGDCERVR
jgi:Ca2+-binding RTX toxin-like protein